MAHASAHSGRAMLGALGLEQYSELFRDAPGPVYLEAIAGGKLIPVFRWSKTGARALAHGCSVELGPRNRHTTWSNGDHWDEEGRAWWVWTDVEIESVGSFVLTMPVFVKEDVRFLQATCSKFRCA